MIKKISLMGALLFLSGCDPVTGHWACVDGIICAYTTDSGQNWTPLDQWTEATLINLYGGTSGGTITSNLFECVTGNC